MQTLERSRKTLDEVREKLAGLEPVLDDALLDAQGSEVHQRARVALHATAGASEGVLHTISDLDGRADLLQSEWTAKRRWIEEGLSDLETSLARLAERKPHAAAQQWIHELLDAVRAGEWDAAKSIVRISLPLPGELVEGAETIRGEFRRWLEGDEQAGLELCNALTSGGVAGWSDVLDAQTMSRVHRVAAWLALCKLGVPDEARRHLEQAVELDPDRGLSYGDRSAYFLALGDLVAAASDAQRAIELSPHDAVGYLYLGAWAELSGEFAEARELYLRGFDKMPTHLITLQPKRASLLEPPGGMLVAAGETLLGRRRSDVALVLLDAALTAGVSGLEPHPDAVVHGLRSRALELEKNRSEAAEAAVEAGKRHHWNNNLSQALEELRRAIDLNPKVADAGWYVADSLIASSVDPAELRPRQEPLREARSEWESWAKKVGLPTGPDSWAYLTRAIIAEKEWFFRVDDRTDARWESVYFVEKALAHQDDDPFRWGFATKYLHMAGLPANALEAAEIGRSLGGTSETLLSERVALLANAGRFEDADQALQEYVSWYGDSPWSYGVKGWLALHLAHTGTGWLDYDRSRLESAVEHFTSAIEGHSDVPWTLELRALSRLALGDVAGAHEDLRSILQDGDPVDGWGKCRLAIAAIALEEHEEAERWLSAAREDDESTRDSLTALAYAALVAGELERGAEEFETALVYSSDTRDLDDTVGHMLLRLRAAGLEAESEPAGVVRQVADEAGARRRAELEAEPTTAEGELAVRLATFESVSSSKLPAQAVALLAVHARRDLRAGEFERAEAMYDRLIGSAFEPEAAIALERTLLAARDAAVEAGNVAVVKKSHERLAKLGSADRVQEALDVSAALLATDDPEAAWAELERVDEGKLDAPQKLDLALRRADIAVARGDGTQSASHLRDALEVTEQAGDRAGAAQIEVRLSFADVLAGDQAAASGHVLAALRNWREAGAFDPMWMLVEEFRGLASSETRGWSQAAPTVREVVGELGDRGELGQFTTIEPDAIEQQLALVGETQAAS